MGYETQLLIGKDTKNSYMDEGTYFQLYAIVDMCKTGNSKIFDLPWINKEPLLRQWYWFAPTGDGDTAITVDRYGDMPQPVPILHVIEALEEDIATGNDYRRIKWALAILKAMQEDSPEGLSVLLWSY